jgi:hypothetical protein
MRQVVGAGSGDFSEEQRARWGMLAARAADEAMLPGDPGFRSGLASCVDWASRTALATSPGDTAEPPPVPRWDWGPAGPPPAADTGQAADDAGQAAQAAQPLPGPDQTVGFEAHVRPLFRERDRQAMSFAFDLRSYDDVVQHAADILDRLQQGSMPCDGAWPAEKVDVFSRWLHTGTQR